MWPVSQSCCGDWTQSETRTGPTGLLSLWIFGSGTGRGNKHERNDRKEKPNRAWLGLSNAFHFPCAKAKIPTQNACLFCFCFFIYIIIYFVLLLYLSANHLSIQFLRKMCVFRCPFRALVQVALLSFPQMSIVCLFCLSLASVLVSLAGVHVV